MKARRYSIVVLAGICLGLAMLEAGCTSQAAGHPQPSPTPIEETFFQDANPTSVPTSAPRQTPLPLDGSLPVIAWKEGHSQLRRVNLATGEDMPGFVPIDIGSFMVYAVSPDGATLAAVAYPSATTPRGSSLHLIDLETWQDAVIPVNMDDWSWVLTMTFSPDGSHLAIAYTGPGLPQPPQNYQIAVVDLGRQTVTAHLVMDIVPRILAYSADGGSLVAYGPANNPEGGPTLAPPAALLLKASDLSILWKATLEGVLDGQYPYQVTADLEALLGETAYTTMTPAVVFSPQAQALYVIHADEDRLTTVNFARREITSVRIEPVKTWLDRLMEWGADAAYAKALDGTHKQAVLSPDGTRLYVVGETDSTTKGSSGNLKFNRKMLGLKVIDVATGAELKTADSEASEISLAPDGGHLFLYGWDENSGREWTDIVDAATLETIRHLRVARALASRTLGGHLILVGGSQGQVRTRMTVLDASTFEQVAEWILDCYCQWVTLP